MTAKTKVTSVLCLSLTAFTAAQAETVGIAFHSGANLIQVRRELSPGAQPVEAALRALAAGPTTDEQAAGIFSAIPAGTTVENISLDGASITIDFSPELIAGLSELSLEQIYRQVKWTLHPFGLDSDISLTAQGVLLSDYLPAPRPVAPRTTKLLNGPAAAGPGASLAGRSITLSPGHGRYWNGSGWVTARPVYCAPLNQEDLHNLEMCQYLETYLLADGMTVQMARCTNKLYGDHYTFHPWWQMGAYLWLQHLGYPCSVYASSTNDCNLGVGAATEHYDDVYSRPMASNYDNTDIYISVHTNGVSGFCEGPGCPTGTETYYDAGEAHAPWGDVSQALANDVHSGIMDALIAHVDPTWVCRGACVKNANGAYGEIRLPQRAAILTEIAFHDTCDRDADTSHLRDNFFRSAAMWGIYKGVCDYFETSPTWDFYSSEYVSDTIPSTMIAGQTYNVSITLRNRGVVWTESRGIRLGAVGESDPFTTEHRVVLVTDVEPGRTYTFNFQMTAPACGDVVSDWQMVRDGYAWFGATVTKNIHVVGVPADMNCDLHVDQADLTYFRGCMTGDGNGPLPDTCKKADLDGDEDADQNDFGLLQRCFTGGGPLDFSCWTF